MKAFTKTIKRSVELISGDRDLPNTVWIIAMGGNGIRLKKLGKSNKASLSLTWRQIIGHALIHAPNVRINSIAMFDNENEREGGRKSQK